MDLDEICIPHHQNTVANAAKLAAEGGDVRVLDDGLDLLYKKLGAIRKGDGLKGIMVIHEYIFRHAVPAHIHHQLIQWLAVDDGAVASVNQHQAAPAGVHHARLGQGRKHLLGAFKDALPAGQHHVHQGREIVRRHGSLLDRVIGNDTGYCQDGALLGLHDGLIGGVRTGLKRSGKLHRGDLMLVTERF